MTVQADNIAASALNATLCMGLSRTTWIGGSLPADLSSFGLRGCSLLVSTESSRGPSAMGGGTAQFTITIPNSPALNGFTLYNQAIVLEPGINPLGVHLSDASCSRFGPQARPTGQVVGSTTIGEGGLLTIMGTGFGDDLDDLCIRGDDGMGMTFMFRAERLTRDPATGLQVLEARLEQVPDNPRPARVGIFRGNGVRVPVLGTARLSAPGSDSWVWDGTDPTANMGLTPQLVTPVAAVGPKVRIRFRVERTTGFPDCIVADIPWDPCGLGGAGGLPPGTTITTDVHWNVLCGASPSKHYDDFMEDVTVIAATNVNAAQIATEHAVQIQQEYDDKYGAGVFDVQGFFGFDASGNPVGRITIKMVDPNCRITGAGGNLILCCP